MSVMKAKMSFKNCRIYINLINFKNSDVIYSWAPCVTYRVQIQFREHEHIEMLTTKYSSDYLMTGSMHFGTDSSEALISTRNLYVPSYLPTNFVE